MKVPETIIVKVIAEASPRMNEAKYITARVERLMRTQPSVSQYVVSFQKDLTVEGVVSVLFFASLIEQAVTLAFGRAPARLGYPQLDLAARTARDIEDLSRDEPDLASFIVSNVELGGAATPVARRILSHVTRALVGESPSSTEGEAGARG